MVAFLLPVLIKRKSLLMQWRRNIKLIDANVILRYLLNDHAEMSLTARILISTDKNSRKPLISLENLRFTAVLNYCRRRDLNPHEVAPGRF